jgi:ribosomal protein S1
LSDIKIQIDFMQQTKFLRKKLKMMELEADFDFDMQKLEQQWKAKTSLMEKMMSGYVFSSPELNEIVTATFVGSTNEYLLFEASFKDYIRVENRPNESKYLKNTAVGDKVDVAIVEIKDKDFIIRGSLSALYETRAHETLLNISEGDFVTAFVKELTPAGYNVEISYEGVTLPGFMPNTLAGINKLYDTDSVLGKTLEVMIESYSGDEGTYIVSRRRYLQTLIKSETAKLERGVVYKGHVTGTTAFGVFVEFNECLTGMIHKTNINPEYQDKIEQIMPGTEIDFYVREIIPSAPFDKIILTQTLKESLWDTIHVGQVLTGWVRENKQFGTLVQLDDETMGLIQTVETERLSKLPNPEDEIKVRVAKVLRQNRKIILTLA